MKLNFLKLVLLPICLALVLVLAACAGQSRSDQPAITESQETPTPDAASATETVRAGRYQPTPELTEVLSSLDATKIALALPPVSEQETAQARQTSVALGTPFRNTNVYKEGMPAVPLGIGGGCLDSLESEYNFIDCWTGTPTSGEFLFVAAGSLLNDPEQGLLRVFTNTLDMENMGSVLEYDTPSRSGPVIIGDVTGPHMTLLTRHPDDDSIPVVAFFFNLDTRTWEEPGQCRLAPIALNTNLIEGLTNHWGLYGAHYGQESGDFGWLTWDGNILTDTLVVSLIPPGDSWNYANPDDPSDHAVSIGDWVVGRPDIDGDDSPAVRSAMFDLAAGDAVDMSDKTKSITSGHWKVTMPVWDRAEMRGESIRYHISGFVWGTLSIPILLDRPNSIAFTYEGRATCPNAP